MKKTLSIGLLSIALISPFNTAWAQDPFLGEIRWFGFDFCPEGWAAAEGQLLDPSRYPELFFLFSTYYGGDGRLTFGLPDLRGRVQVGFGQGPGLNNYIMGEMAGSESVTLTEAEMPAHSHAIKVSPGTASYSGGANGVLATAARSSGNGKKKTDVSIYDGPGTATQSLADDSMDDTGGGGSHNNLPPYLTLKACVAMVGIFPSHP
jgi:microcystin-dependent protein